MPEKSRTKTYAASKFLNTSARVSSAATERSAYVRSAASNRNGHGGEASRQWCRELEHKDFPKGVKSEAAMRNKQQQETGVLSELLKSISTNDPAELDPMPPPRCTSKAALEIRARHMDSEVAKAMDSRQSYELPVQKPRCQGNEAMRNRAMHLDSRINFEDMFADYPVTPKTKLGPSADCARNFQRSKQSDGMSTALSHDYERELTPPPPRRLNYGGIRTGAKMQGDQMSMVMHGEVEEFDKRPPKLGASSLARSVYEQHRGSGDTWLRGAHEGDEFPAPRVRFGGQSVAESSSGGAMRQTLHEQNEPEPQPALCLPSRAARQNYDSASGAALKTAVFADYCTAPVDQQPVPKTRSTVAEEVRSHGMNGTAHLLLNKYGKLMADDKPDPTIRFGARGIYKKSQGGAMRQALHGPPKRRSRPRSANM